MIHFGRALVRCIITGLLLSSVALRAGAQPVPPTSVPAVNYATLAAQSASLSPADRAHATGLFKTAFSLWQSGDFAAAEIGFKQGLDIDPANPLANYYYGDCLARRKDKADAKDYLARAVAFGGSTAEGLKAQAELQELSVAPTRISEMDQAQVSSLLIGQWRLTGEGVNNVITITAVDGPIITASGHFGDILSGYHFKGGRIDGDQITIMSNALGVEEDLVGHMISSTQIDLVANGYHLLATKQ